ncbi:CREG1 PROTEIN [Salix koriyanagi]|uniref:CREG1 PROTEIN n=1 Tax=Salix koriyanagi TaxID=2511006 RepID=A0A9Q1A4E8_9ROSI|nr:CREG1 PROTEIN [Salix koriyanagi]
MASVAHSSTQAVSTGDVNSDASVFQLIQTHQEKAARLPPVEEIRTVLNQSTHGMLSTISQLAQLNGVVGDVMKSKIVVEWYYDTIHDAAAALIL